MSICTSVNVCLIARRAVLVPLRYRVQSSSLLGSTLAPRQMASATSFYDFKPLDKKGQPYPTTDLRNKVVLIINTASKCGFTPQLEELQTLYKKVRGSPNGSDFEILGFPCNQFGNQSPENNDDTQSFCQLNYGVEFPILGKTEVNGDSAEPLFTWLKKEQPGLLGLKRVKWNFEKWLVGRDGRVKGRWASTKKPLTLEDDINKELQDVNPEQAGVETVTPAGAAAANEPLKSPVDGASKEDEVKATSSPRVADGVTPSSTENPTESSSTVTAPTATGAEPTPDVSKTAASPQVGGAESAGQQKSVDGITESSDAPATSTTETEQAKV